jgi:PAS domain S-box-containing protein
MAVNLPGYSVTGPLHEGASTNVFRARRVEDGESVVVRVLRTAADEASWDRYRLEYDLLRELGGNGVVEALALESVAERPALVLKAAAGEVLGHEPFAGPGGIRRFLSVALRLTRIVERVHAARVIHGDIKPRNVLIDPETDELVLIDFGIAQRLAPEQKELFCHGALRGSLPYVSPEQTGRMERGIDARSDLYSLGATFYELLCGRPPFLASDPLEAIHAHLARQPVSPIERRVDVPAIVSAIIMKLTAKEPGDRYQSAAGLASDLARCVREYGGTGGVGHFELGREDTPERLVLPRTLYGRETELQALVDAWHGNAAGDCRLALISGPAGCGKSALAAAMRMPVVSRRGYFITGKFDQYRRDIPYSAVAEAFSMLAQRFLAESDARLKDLRGVLVRELGGVARVMTDLVPDLVHIVGEQPELEPVEPNEARNRFLLATRRFVGAVSTPDRPIVLVLDDLQWADSGSLMLLEDMLGLEAAGGLFIIGCYRDGEVGEHHPFGRLLATLRAGGIDITDVPLAPLSRSAVRDLLADALRRPDGDVEALAGLIGQRTENNPFFVHQFLLYLAELGLFEWQSGLGWIWNQEEIRAAGVPDDVVSLMTAKIERLPARLSLLLKQASCIGTIFDENTLLAVGNEREEDLVLGLRLVAAQGFISAITDGWMFVHDRIQEAAHALLDEEERMHLHLEVGRFFMARTGAEDLDEHLFDIVDHLLRALPLIETPPERTHLAGLCLTTGKKAMAAAAYDPAARYLETGSDLLPEDSWTTRFDLTFALRLETARCAFLRSDVDAATAIFDDLLTRDLPLPDLGRAVATRASQLVTAGRPEQAVRLVQRNLRKCGFHLPDRGSRPRVLWHAVQAAWAMKGKSGIEALDAPPVRDAAAAGALEMLPSITAATYFTDHRLMLVTCLLHQRLIMRFGYHPTAGQALANYAMMVAGGLGTPTRASVLGRAALEMCERQGDARANHQGRLAASTFVLPWAQPFDESIRILAENVVRGPEVGDFEHASFSWITGTSLRHYGGANLAEVAKACARGGSDMLHWGYPDMAALIHGMGRGIGLLTGSVEFDPEAEDPLGLEALKLYESGVVFPYALGHTVFSLYLLGHVELAFRLSDENARVVTENAFASQEILETRFCHGLAAGTLAGDARGVERRRLLGVLRKERRWLTRCARYCANNFRHKADLLRAEMARLRGDGEKAMSLYAITAAGAEAGGFTHIQALANERLASLADGMSLTTMARLHFGEARRLYDRWGASRKVAEMDPAASGRSSITRSAEHASSLAFDVKTVLKAAHAISREIRLDLVVKRVLELAIENAGAEKAVLLLDREGVLLVQAEAGVDGTSAQFGDGIPLEECRRAYPGAIIRLAARTANPVVLEEASSDERFAEDPYVLEVRPKSVVCLPILEHARLVGVLCLENNLTTGAFTTDRLDVLGILASEAAVSIENARLYEALRTSEARLRDILDNSPAIISVKDTEGRYLLVNRGFERIADRPREDILGATDLDLFPEDAAKRFRGHDQQALRQCEPIEFDEDLPGRDGNRTYISVKFPLLAPDGQPYAVCGISTDITARRLALAELNRLRVLLRNSVDSMPSVLVGVDFEGRVTQWNSKAELATSIRSHEALGRKLPDVFPRLADRMDEVHEAIETRRPIEQTGVSREVDGETIFEDVTVYPLTGEGVEGAVLRIDDATERVRIEEMMVQSEKMLSVGGLAAGMAHEINNPLAGILQNLQVMKDRLLGDLRKNDEAAAEVGTTMETLRAYVEKRGIPAMMAAAQEAGRRATETIVNMLSFSRKGRQQERTPADLRILLDRTIDLTSTGYDHKKKYDFRRIEIVREYEEGLPEVPCEASQIQQVVFNIVTNAAQAMAEGADGTESPSRLVLRLAEEAPERMLRIEIADNGPGMDEETRRRIFEPFFTTKPPGVGTGLGLSVSYFIVTETHGGTLSVESAPGAGTRFVIRLPLEVG